MSSQPTLFAFPIGARGDFLISILRGNILKYDWDKLTVNRSIDGPNIVKLHGFGRNEFRQSLDVIVGPENLSQFLTFRISVDSKQDLLDIGYFALQKRNPSKELENFYAFISLINGHENEFSKYRFDYVIPFSKLKDIDYIQQLYNDINQRELTLEELSRIKHNIDINQKILDNNPFTINHINRAFPIG